MEVLQAKVADLEHRVGEAEKWKKWFGTLAKMEVQDRRRIEEIEDGTAHELSVAVGTVRKESAK